MKRTYLDCRRSRPRRWPFVVALSVRTPGRYLLSRMVAQLNSRALADEAFLESYRERYLFGDCWVLALEIASQGGWAVAITPFEDHAFALSPCGGFALDVNGLQAREDLLERWGAGVLRGPAASLV